MATQRELARMAALDLRLGPITVDLCDWVPAAIAFFERLQARTSNWKVWAQAAYAVTLAALKAVADDLCDDSNPEE